MPASLTVGRGNVLYLTGRCYHPQRLLRALDVLVDGTPHPVVNHSLLRPDVPCDDPAIGDTVPNSLTSGFWVALPFARIADERVVELRWRALLDDGRRCELPLGSVRLVPGDRERSAPAGAAADALVAICLATHNPDLRFFAEQIESLRRQTHTRWTCIVGDDDSARDRLRAIEDVIGGDPRFALVHWSERIGHYGNFARALARVPEHAAYVALADQDDVWYPDKLARTLAAFTGDTTLVYGDLDVVDRDGTSIASTYWTTRRNNYSDLASLVFANTVTGAASVFRADLLPDVLPFPPRIGEAYADHWIASVALTKGPLGYVDAALHAYRQHGTNVLGHFAPPPHRMLPRADDVARAFGPGGVRRGVMAELWRHREVYGADVVRLIVIARVLLLRLGAVTAPEKRAVLERIAALEAAPFGLVRETMAALVERRPTLGAEWHCLRGTVAARLLDWHYRRNRERLFADRTARRDVTGSSGGPSPTAAVALIEQKIAPLRLRARDDEPRRVNLLTPTIDFAHLFAGYLGKLHLALRLADAGERVRLVIVDPGEHDPPAWRRALAGYPGLETLLDRVEVADAADRERPLAVHPRDAFIATTWWTAHVAHRSVRALGRPRFLYLIQEFEPMTFPMGSLHALAAESYAFPHRAVFSTALLRDWFHAERLGVYADGGAGDAAALAFENAITAFTVDREALARPGPRRLLFYARPEQHAARNMFELGVLALRRLVADGALDPTAWRVDGIGAGRAFAPVALGRGQELRLLPRVDLAEYRMLLPGYDVGLSLMLTPHPSLVPLEMAAAGLLTVTNTYANKDAAALTRLSSNLIPAAPTIDGIAAGLADAVAHAGDLERRVAGSRVAWSTSWTKTFDDALLARLMTFLAED
jgi:hypothetical protein